MSTAKAPQPKPQGAGTHRLGKETAPRGLGPIIELAEKGIHFDLLTGEYQKRGPDGEIISVTDR